MSKRVSEPKFYTRLGYIVLLTIGLMAVILVGLPRFADRMRETKVVVVDTVKVVTYPRHGSRSRHDSTVVKPHRKRTKKVRKKPVRPAPPPRNPLSEPV